MRLPTFSQIEHFIVRLIVVILLLLAGSKVIKEEARSLSDPAQASSAPMPANGSTQGPRGP